MGGQARSAAPALQQIYPAALRVGSTNEVTLVGTFDPWPVEVWTSATGLTFQPSTNKGRLNIVVAADAPEGPALLRCHNGDGASDPAIFRLTSSEILAEVEPNDDFRKPQPLGVATVGVNGRLDKSGDVDSYGVELAAGQTLVARLNAYVLASPFDGVMRLLDEAGTQVAWNHDFGDTLDPRLVWTAPKAGKYIIQVFGFAYPAGSEIQFTGSARCVYWVEVTNGPIVGHTVPLSLAVGGANQVKLAGWNLPAPLEAGLEVSAPAAPRAAMPLPVGPEVGGLAEGIPVARGVSILEAEPNDKVDAAHPLSIPFDVTGTYGKAMDQDRFAFQAIKGGLHLFQILSSQLGFLTDPWLAIEESSGKELARNDDSPSNDPQIVWQAPADGVYVVATGNLIRRGGDDLLYRLVALPESPRIEATAAASSLLLEAGKTNKFTIATRRRHGHSADTALTVSGLPSGVTCATANIPPKDGEVSLEFVAASDAPAFSGEFQVSFQEAGKEQRIPVTHELVTSSVNNGVPAGYQRLWVERFDRFWLTVKPAAPAAAPAQGGSEIGGAQ